MRKELIAMILAGGQGSRLGVLTKNLAKPAIPFGGKYRIIDFALSNCINSGVDTVGVLTQYQPLLLNSYIGIGIPWDLDRVNGGVTILPPFIKGKQGEWYKGTANAIYQNINYIEKFDPEYVLILSGDHIYSMDYSKMLNFHKSKRSVATIAVIEVLPSEASRFGIMNTDDDGSIIEFEEKPEKPKSNLASMGVYIFNWRTLKKYLINDAGNSLSKNDFGKNIIPFMIRNEERMYAYPFKGYWKDVGTINTLWEANMDLLEYNPKLNLYDKSWRVYYNNPALPPQYIAPSSNIASSAISEGCIVYGDVDHSIISTGAYIGEGSIVKDSIIMPGSIIGDYVEVNKCIVAENVTIRNGSKIGLNTRNIGSSKKLPITVIGQNIFIKENSIIERGTIVDYNYEEKPDIKKKAKEAYA